MKIDFEKVLKDYGLKEGDKVEIEGLKYNPYTICYNGSFGWFLEDNESRCTHIGCLINGERERVEPNKRVGLVKCKEIECFRCPLRHFNCCYVSRNDTLIKIWEKTLENRPQLEPMREWVEKELNKEVEE